MRVREVMTRDPVAVTPETTLKEAAALLVERAISGLPVVDADRRVVGVLSETDIVRKEVGTERGSFLDWVVGVEPLRPSAARTAAEAMTAPAITTVPDADVAKAARLMIEEGINRLPVVGADGKLEGIVARSDLVRVFVRPDEDIAREIRDDVILEALWIDPETVDVRVESGTVTLTGELPTKADAELLERFVQRVPGVVSIGGELTWRVDEPRLPTSDPRVPIARRER